MAGVLSLNGTFTYPIELLKTLTVDQEAKFNESVSIGESSVEDGKIGFAIGRSASVNGDYSISIGNGAQSDADESVAVGKNTVSNGENSIALGISAKTNEKNSLVWSGTENASKNPSNGEGTFSVYPSGGANGFYIEDKNLTTVIYEKSKEAVQANSNSFTGSNSFANEITAKNGINVESGNLTVSQKSSFTLNGSSSVPDSQTSDSSNRIANTRYVKNNISTCVLLSGSTMTGKLTLSGDPEENMHAATKQYVDSHADKVTINNSYQRNGKDIAKIVVSNSAGSVETTIKAPKIVAGQNTTVTNNEGDGTVTISCNPNISLVGGTIKVPVGTIIPFAGSNVPVGFLFCDGSRLSTTDYSELYAAIGHSFTPDSEKIDTNHFRIPDLSDNRFLEGAESNGTYKDAGLPNITGTFDGNINDGDEGKTGSFFKTTSSWNGSDGLSTSTGGLIGFDASRISSIYGASSTVQPKSVTIKYYIKYTQTTEEKYVLSVNDITPDSEGNVAVPVMYGGGAYISHDSGYYNPSTTARESDILFSAPKDCAITFHMLTEDVGSYGAKTYVYLRINDINVACIGDPATRDNRVRNLTWNGLLKRGDYIKIYSDDVAPYQIVWSYCANEIRY